MNDEQRSYYIVRLGCTTVSNLPLEGWDFFIGGQQTIFSDTGFLRYLDMDDAVREVVATLERGAK